MEQKQWIDLNNKVVIVTGGAMGTGEAIVRDLLTCNTRVAIFDLAKPRDFFGDDRRMYARLDIRNKKEIEAVVDTVVQKFDTADTLVNDVGATGPRILVDYYGNELQYELSEEDSDLMVGINQKGTFLISQAVTRVLYGKKEDVIINLSSCAGLMDPKGHSCYSATKAAIHAFMISWAREPGPYNIRVVGAVPGTPDRTPTNNDEEYRAQAYGRGWDVNTRPEELFKDYKSSIPLGGPGHLCEVAGLICYLTFGRASYITGATISVSGGKSKG